MEEITLLEDVFLFLPDGTFREGAIAFSPAGIVAVGDRNMVRGKGGKKAKNIRLPGALVIPGFCDGHTHMLAGAMQHARLNLREARDRKQVLARVAAWVAEHPDNPWILGQWDESSWGGELPDRTWVDEACGARPLFLTRSDMHSAFANSKALEIGGVRKETPDPPGGRISRDPRTGEATGLLLEKAMELVSPKIPETSEAEKIRSLKDAFAFAHRLGITAVHDVFFRSSWDVLGIYRSALESSETGLKVYLRVLLKDLDRLLGLREEFPPRMFLDGVKDFIDGSLGSTTAWLEEPYTHAPSEKGISCLENIPEFREEVKRAAGAGVTVSLHAIGDAAISLAQDVFLECIDGKVGRAPLRIEHFQHPSPENIAAMGHPRLFASLQPAHLQDDAAAAEQKLGPERAALSYPVKALVDRGVPVIFGSDWDVADLNPLVGIHAAVTRVDKGGKFPRGWHPEQRITPSQALRCYTAVPSRGTRILRRTGELKEGWEADLTVLDRNILCLLPEEIPCARVIMTIISGHSVYDAV